MSGWMNTTNTAFRQCWKQILTWSLWMKPIKWAVQPQRFRGTSWLRNYAIPCRMYCCSQLLLTEANQTISEEFCSCWIRMRLPEKACPILNNWSLMSSEPRGVLLWIMREKSYSMRGGRGALMLCWISTSIKNKWPCMMPLRIMYEGASTRLKGLVILQKD